MCLGGVVSEASENLVRVMNDAGSPLTAFTPGVEAGNPIYEIVPDAKQAEEQRKTEQKAQDEQAKADAEQVQWRDEADRVMGRIVNDPKDELAYKNLVTLRNDKRFKDLPVAERNEVDNFIQKLWRWEQSEEAAQKRRDAGEPEPAEDPPPPPIQDDLDKIALSRIETTEDTDASLPAGPAAGAGPVAEPADNVATPEAEEVAGEPEVVPEPTVEPVPAEVDDETPTTTPWDDVPFAPAEPQPGEAAPASQPEAQPTAPATPEAEAVGEPAPSAPQTPQDATTPVEYKPIKADTITASDKTEHDVEYAIVEAASLIASHDHVDNVNPCLLYTSPSPRDS